MDRDSLRREFRKFEGNPVKIFTDDGKTFTGIDLGVDDDAVRILDDCGRIIFITFSHIDTVVEPMMKLDRCCNRCRRCREDFSVLTDGDCRENGHDRDFDDDFCDRDEFRGRGFRNEFRGKDRNDKDCD